MSHDLSPKIITLVLAHYGVTASHCQYSVLGNGLINSTYLVECDDKCFVLQHINQQVFPKPLEVINNADLISQHLTTKHQQQRYPLMPVTQLRTQTQDNHVKVQGQFWRALPYLGQSYSLETMTTLQQAADTANAFAQFSAALSDFNSADLAPVIPQFHDLALRLKQLKHAITNTSACLQQQAQGLIHFIGTQQSFIDSITAIMPTLPQRVCHNDTKINNLLFSKHSHKPMAVIDLDTCMAGYLMHDFGDMVRSCCPSIAEDSANLAEMAIDWPQFNTLAQAYIAGLNGILSEQERTSLAIGVKLMPFMLGIRFLTDFLAGNRYFKIDYPEHNLVRAKNQLHLYQLFCQQQALLSNIYSA
ncbi:Phosphotransferase enzyme family protein [Colwellia chukchiensis]|uniref:Phosphotransferase enzyme family protein n=1 Tax=Colwellia chukchiensis TaxID=641665 RepID=A0A1H7NEH8_9GAMM|nr:aminoglycoside phosphotransferase family protein [Colwellia chukchiensis]SEL21721.1 Phosphotransferase enzyme family protein [Colwellia chukchiensis]